MSAVAELSTRLSWSTASRTGPAPRVQGTERARWIASRIVACVGLAALFSVLPTPLRGLMHGPFGGGGVVGPITSTTSIVFWSLGLLLTARGLRHGHLLAWALTLAFAALTVSLHLARHNDPVEAILLGLGAVALVLHREAFRVQVSKRATTRSLALFGVVLVLGAVARVTRHHLPVNPDVGAPDAPHRIAAYAPMGFGGGVLPATLLGTALVLLACILWVFLSPLTSPRLTDLEHSREREQARRIVASHGRGTLDYFALRDDKRWFFYAHSLVSYAVRFGVCLVSPDPVGPVEERREVWTAFMEHARTNGWSVSILGASAEWTELYRSFGLHPVYLGDEAVVRCSTFSLEGRPMRGLRQACSRVDRAGYTVSFHDPTEVDAATRAELLQLATISRAGAVERGFSMTLSRLFDDADTGLLLSISRDPAGRARAFVQWTPAPGINGWSLDVMRYDTGPEAPNGVMDHLIVATIRHLSARGEDGLGLNFAVLRTLMATQASTPLGRSAQRLLHVVSGRTQIASLAHFNQKFEPQWQPRYVVLGSLDTVACQGLVIAAAEGLSDLPVIGRFMKGLDR